MPNKDMRKNTAFIAFVLAAVCLGLALCSCAGGKTFQAGRLKITLTEDFAVFGEAGYAGIYVSQTDEPVYVFITKDDISALKSADDLSIESYAKMKMESNEMAVGAELKSLNGIPYYVYDAMGESKMLTNFVFFYKDGKICWTVVISTQWDKADQKRNEIFKYAKSVTFVK